MKTNKMLPDSSISKVWENFRKMNGIVIEFLANNWVTQSNGTFTNTIEYDGFTSDDILEVDLYDDGTLTETQISEYDGYITEFNVEDGKIVAIATTKPTQTIKILARGEIVGKMIVNGGSSSNISASNVSCLDKNGQTSNVQKELDEQNKNYLQWWIDNGYLPDPTNLRTYLYCLGNLCEDITGGWDTILNGTLKQYSRYMEYTISGSSERNAFGTTNMITIPSTAKKLCIHFEYLKMANDGPTSDQTARILPTKYTSSGSFSSALSYSYTQGEYSDYTVEIPINEACTGYFYPVLFNGPGYNWTVVARIDKIWYE